jgi:hypothetical protein
MKFRVSERQGTKGEEYEHSYSNYVYFGSGLSGGEYIIYIILYSYEEKAAQSTVLGGECYLYIIGW